MSNEKDVAIVAISEPLAVLAAQNRVYYDGQHVWAKDEHGNKGLKVGDWRPWDGMAKELATPFNDLPWIINPVDAGSAKSNIFSVVNTDIARYSYDAGTNTITVTDERLKGKEDYPVLATQLGGGALREDQVTYDAVNGKVFISGFELEDNARLYIIVPTGISGDPDYVALNARMDALEALNDTVLAPLVSGGAKLWWPGTLDTIPAGYRECVAMRGYYPMHIKTGDADFDGDPGTPVSGGAKTFGITSTDQLPRFRLYTTVNSDENISGQPSEAGRDLSAVRSFIKRYFKIGGGSESYALCGSSVDNVEPSISPTSYTGQSPASPIKHLQPSLKGYWIELAV